MTKKVRNSTADDSILINIYFPLPVNHTGKMEARRKRGEIEIRKEGRVEGRRDGKKEVKRKDPPNTEPFQQSLKALVREPGQHFPSLKHIHDSNSDHNIQIIPFGK